MSSSSDSSDSSEHHHHVVKVKRSHPPGIHHHSSPVHNETSISSSTSEYVLAKSPIPQKSSDSDCTPSSSSSSSSSSSHTPPLVVVREVESSSSSHHSPSPVPSPAKCVGCVENDCEKKRSCPTFETFNPVGYSVSQPSIVLVEGSGIIEPRSALRLNGYMLDAIFPNGIKCVNDCEKTVLTYLTVLFQQTSFQTSGGIDFAEKMFMFMEKANLFTQRLMGVCYKMDSKNIFPDVSLDTNQTLDPASSEWQKLQTHACQPCTPEDGVYLMLVGVSGGPFKVYRVVVKVETHSHHESSSSSSSSSPNVVVPPTYYVKFICPVQTVVPDVIVRNIGDSRVYLTLMKFGCQECDSCNTGKYCGCEKKHDH